MDNLKQFRQSINAILLLGMQHRSNGAEANIGGGEADLAHSLGHSEGISGSPRLSFDRDSGCTVLVAFFLYYYGSYIDLTRQCSNCLGCALWTLLSLMIRACTLLKSRVDPNRSGMCSVQKY